jgi:methylase of polypeptide subunit release factors
MAIFQRNLTSELIEKQSVLFLSPKKTLNVLELGCGDGNISRNLRRHSPQHTYFASDVSAEAVMKARELDTTQLIDFKNGNLFEPWVGQRFDVIISDVASISSIIALMSDWYQGVPCDSGETGLDLIIPVIRQLPEYLNPEGVFIIPVLSISRYWYQIELLKTIFEVVEIRDETKWPLPKNLWSTMKTYGLAGTCENWVIEEKFGIPVAFTSVAVCQILREN